MEDNDTSIKDPIVYYDLYFPSSDQLKLFLRAFKELEDKRGNEPLTDKESDIVLYSLIKPRNFMIIDVQWTKMKIELFKEPHRELYGENSWLPFLAKYMVGEFHIKGQWDEIWGAKLYANGEYDKLTAETTMVKEHE